MNAGYHETQSGSAYGTTVTPRQSAGQALALAGVVVAGALALVGVSLWCGVKVSVWLTPRPEPALHARLAALPAAPNIPEGLALQGRDVFERACAQCHSSSGLGKQGLGKDIVRSDFVADATDASLVAFVLRGRPADDPLNTTKVAMPPKGGIDTLTESDIQAVVTYVRGLQDPRRMPVLPEWKPAPVVVSEKDKADALAAAGGDAELAGYIASGSKLYAGTCQACHGAGGVGVKGNGKALVNNEFVQSLDDDGLLAFIQKGRDPGDPKNTTGVGMPAKGGNPALKEDDFLDIIAYLRTLQPAKAAGAAK